MNMYSNLNAGGYNIWLEGTGIFNLDAKIEDFDTLYKSNGCDMVISNTGGFN